MKPHKHSELIKEWADGAEIEYFSPTSEKWVEVGMSPAWSNNFEYRIKPEPKYDVVVPYFVNKLGSIRNPSRHDANVFFTFDGETGELKSAEVLK